MKLKYFGLGLLFVSLFTQWGDLNPFIFKAIVRIFENSIGYFSIDQIINVVQLFFIVVPFGVLILAIKNSEKSNFSRFIALIFSIIFSLIAVSSVFVILAFHCFGQYSCTTTMTDVGIGPFLAILAYIILIISLFLQKAPKKS